MSQSVAGHTKCRVTESAWEWLLPSVGKCVSNHVAFVRSYLVANPATPHLNSMLREFFNLKYVRMIRFQIRNQSDLIQRIYLFTVSLMSGLVGWKLKSLIAKLAQIVSFFSMNHNVSLPVLLEAKTFSTKPAEPFNNLPSLSHPHYLGDLVK